MNDSASNAYENLLKRYNDLMNLTLNKDYIIKNIAQRLE